MNGLRDSVEGFTENLDNISPREVVEMMMITQYFDMLRDIGSTGKANAIFTTQSDGGLGQ